MLLAVPVVSALLDIATEYHYKEGKLQSLNFHLHMKVWKERERKIEGCIVHGDMLISCLF